MTTQIAIVGGSSGIGLALVEHLIKEDTYQVALLGRNAPPTTGANITHFPCDISADKPSFPELTGALGGLVYLPGTINLKPFSQLTVDDFKRDFDLNVLGAVKVIQHYLPLLKEAPSASIALLATVAVQRGFPFHASISAAKGAVFGLMRALAAELAPTIRVNAIAPSITETPLSAPITDTEQKKDASAKRHPLKRIGQPADIANMIAYLLSDKASWITGQLIGVDGGISVL
ncbi:MAG: SDR family oxidoreductase [Chlamydiota bacterium]